MRDQDEGTTDSDKYSTCNISDLNYKHT